MTDAQVVMAAIRTLVQVGITVDQYRQASNKPDISNAELERILDMNQSRIDDLLDQDHGND
jgi:hypothetical protein